MRPRLVVTIALAAAVAAAAGLVASRRDVVATGGGLRVEPAALRFEGPDRAGVLTLRNDGGEPLAFSISPDVDWLAIAPNAGTLAPRGTASVSVRRMPSAGGDAVVVVSAGGVDTRVEVAAEPTGPPLGAGPGRLTVDPPAIDLGAGGTAADVVLANGGAAPLTWSARGSENWLGVEPRRGRLGGGERATVALHVDRVGLPVGTHRAAVTVDWEGGSTTLSVAVGVTSPIAVSVAPARIRFAVSRGGTATKPFEIRNTGDTPITYRASVAKDYVRIVAGATGTVAAGGSARVEVLFDHDAAFDGHRRVPVTVSWNGGSASVIVTGTTDSTGPRVTARDMTPVHQHCRRGDCERHRDVLASMTDDLGTVEGAEVQWQVCAGVPGGDDVSCDGWRTTRMRLGDDGRWRAHVGPLPACSPGMASYIPWRIWTEDGLGNRAATPGSSAFDVGRLCSAAGG